MNKETQKKYISIALKVIISISWLVIAWTYWNKSNIETPQTEEPNQETVQEVKDKK